MQQALNEPGKIYTRPWGWYQTLMITPTFQVKILAVNPGGRLSLQRHAKRSEHWVVVKGTPTLTVGEEKRVYQRDEKVYIPIHCIHRIENFGAEECQLIEVQVGDYLGEDDIERLEDVYGRA